MNITNVPQGETESMIFGAGAQTYDWWHRFIKPHAWEDSEAFPFQAPDGWAWDVTGENPDDEHTEITVRVTHATLMNTFAKIRDGHGKVGQKCRAECHQMAADYDAVDFDADTADQVLQVAVFGQVYYG
jgi:hypothetical protein